MLYKDTKVVVQPVMYSDFESRDLSDMPLLHGRNPLNIGVPMPEHRYSIDPDDFLYP